MSSALYSSSTSDSRRWNTSVSFVLSPSMTAWIFSHYCFRDQELGARLMEALLRMELFLESGNFSEDLSPSAGTRVFGAVTSPVLICYIIMLNPNILEHSPIPLSALDIYSQFFPNIPYTDHMLPAHLYLHIFQSHNQIDAKTLTSIISTPQPPEILQQLVNKLGCDWLFTLPVDNLNLWASLKMVNPLSENWIRRLMKIYFVGEMRNDRSDEAMSDGQIRRHVFLQTKEALKKKRVESLEMVTCIFEEEYLQSSEMYLQPEEILKMVELVFSEQPYRLDGRLENSPRFRRDLLRGLMDFQSLFSSLLSINIYSELCRVFDDQSVQTRSFIELYATLNSFGVHLIKDVWEQVHHLANSDKKTKLFPVTELLNIILLKVWKHKNDNVPKNCIKAFLKSKAIDRVGLLRKHPEVAFCTLMKILNSGQFYLDAPQIMDSKFSASVTSFFASALNGLELPLLQPSLKNYLQAVAQHVVCDQALPAFLLVFKHLKRNTHFFGPKQIELTTSFINKIYGNLHVRKRWQLLDGLVDCLRHLNKQVTFSNVLQLLSHIPDEAYTWHFIHDADLPAGENPAEWVCPEHQHTFLLRPRLKYLLGPLISKDDIASLKEESFKSQQKADQLYRLGRVFDIEFPDIREFVHELSLSCYSSCQSIALALKHIRQQITLAKDPLIETQPSITLVRDYIQRSFQQNDFSKDEVACTVAALAQYIFRKCSKETEPLVCRKDIAQFTEWLVYSITHQEEIQSKGYYELLLELLGTVVKTQADIVQKQYFIEDCLYELYGRIDSVKEAKGLKLRVQVFLAVLLSRDKTFSDQHILNRLLADPLSLIDQYDYRRFPELGQFLESQFIPYALSHFSHEALPAVITEVADFLLKSLVCNLEYCMTKAEVLCYSNFAFDSRLIGVVDLEPMVRKALVVGKESLVIKRPVIDQVYKGLIKNYQKLCEEQKLIAFAPVVLIMLQHEEYRGFDGEILFYEEQSSCKEIMQLRPKIPAKGQYYGAYPRYLFMEFIDKMVKKQELNGQQYGFLVWITKRIVEDGLKENAANKMLFTDPFRFKLRSWQALQVIIPFWLKQAKEIDLDWLFTILPASIQQSNQPQIKFYMQLFCTRLILGFPSRSFPLICSKLKQSGNSLNCSISYVIIGGLLIRRQFNVQVYSLLLTYICANTAYLRGLAQYFCFADWPSIQLHVKSSIVQGLREQFENAPDSQRLVDKIDELVRTIVRQIGEWNFQWFCRQPLYKAGEIIEEYHMEALKRIGLEVVQEIKQKDDFFPLFKDMWRTQAKPSIPKVAEEGRSFQRKVDPVLEEIYELNEKVEAKTQLKILASSLKLLHNYGHLVRTSEIFSVQELAVRDIKILEDEEFKSVSCTGEKWLGIVEVKDRDMLQYISKCLQEGYQPIKLDTKGQALELTISRLPRKCLLVLADDNKWLSQVLGCCAELALRIGEDLSVHVEAAVCTWAYVKQHLL